MERMVASLNSHKDMPLQQMLDAMKKDVDTYAGHAPQFDDTTMLALRLTGLLVRDGIRMAADAAVHEKLREYLGGQLYKKGI